MAKSLRRSPGLIVLAAALALPAALSPDVLTVGGLAPFAAAGVVAVFVGIPLSAIEVRRAGERDPTVAVSVDALAQLMAVVLVAAALAPWLESGGERWAAAGLWVLAGAGVLLAGRLPAIIAGAAAVAVAPVLAGQGLLQAPPWTLLEPRWETWSSWLGPSITAGFLLAGFGVNQWSGARGVGERRLPWLVSGAVMLASCCVLLRHAALYEASLGQVDADPAMRLWVTLAVFAAASAVLSRDLSRGALAGAVVAGALATVWMSGAASGAVAVWWATLLPIGMAITALTLAVHLRGAARGQAAGACVALLFAAVVGWPGLPEHMAGAAAASLVVVAGVWVVGTRALMASQARVEA